MTGALTQAETFLLLAGVFEHMAERSPPQARSIIKAVALFDADGRDVCRVNLGRPRLRSRAKDRRRRRGPAGDAEKAPVG